MLRRVGCKLAFSSVFRTLTGFVGRARKCRELPELHSLYVFSYESPESSLFTFKNGYRRSPRCCPHLDA